MESPEFTKTRGYIHGAQASPDVVSHDLLAVPRSECYVTLGVWSVVLDFSLGGVLLLLCPRD